MTIPLERTSTEGCGKCHKVATIVQKNNKAGHQDELQTNVKALHISRTPQNHIWNRHLVHPSEHKSRSDQKFGISQSITLAPEGTKNSLTESLAIIGALRMTPTDFTDAHAGLLPIELAIAKATERLLTLPDT